MSKANYQTFLKMMGELNDYIVNEYDKNYILDIRAIGGFSIMIHKNLGHIDTPRERSKDIDSLTNDFPEKIVLAIKAIGQKYGVDDIDGWLNNHWNQTKHYNEEFSYFVRWTRLEDASFSNIQVYYADLESLFMFKIRAMDDRINLAKMEPREQDVADVVAILKALDITTMNHINNNTIRNTIQYFPYAVNYLIDNNLVPGSYLSINNKQTVNFENTEYGKNLLKQVKGYNELQTIHNMEEIWFQYFDLPQDQKNGIHWDGKVMRPALFEDIYLAKCQEAEVVPNEKIKGHFWNNCVKYQDYEPQYCIKAYSKSI